MQLDREPRPALEAAALDHPLAAGGLHAREEAVDSLPSSDFGLVSTLWHDIALDYSPVACGCQIRRRPEGAYFTGVHARLARHLDPVQGE